MIEQTAQVIFGTVLYVAVLWEARRSPRAAGTMLTFPTLNGISMLVADPVELKQVVSTMLLIPVVNGISCAAYIGVFGIAFCSNSSAAKVSWLVLIAVVSSWILLAWQITLNSLYVPSDYQLIYLVLITLAGLAATWAFPTRRPRKLQTAQSEPLGHLLRRNWSRIVLFAAALSAVVLSSRFQLSTAFVGVLGALPLVPFFSLHTIASDNELPPEARREELAGMANGVWLGPPIAVCFILGFSQLLSALDWFVDGFSYRVLSVIALLLGWGLSILAIWACEKLLHRASSEANLS